MLISYYQRFLRHRHHSCHVAKETKLKCLTFSRIYGFVAFGPLVSETSNPRRGRRSISRICGTLSLLRQLFIMIDIRSRIVLHPRANAREPKYGAEDCFELKAIIYRRSILSETIQSHTLRL
jgi:hypothetical protein